MKNKKVWAFLVECILILAMSVTALAGTTIGSSDKNIQGFTCRAYMAANIAGSGAICGGTEARSSSVIPAAKVSVQAFLYDNGGALVASSTVQSSNGRTTNVAVTTDYRSSYGIYYSQGYVWVDGVRYSTTATNRYSFNETSSIEKPEVSAFSDAEGLDGFIKARGVDGNLGYVKETELIGIEEDGFIPLYNEDGSAVIGLFEVRTIVE